MTDFLTCFPNCNRAQHDISLPTHKNHTIMKRLFLLTLLGLIGIGPATTRAALSSPNGMAASSTPQSGAAVAGNTTALEKAIANAESVIANTAQCLPGALDDLKDLVTLAQGVVAEGTFAQNYIDDLTQRLNTQSARVTAAAGRSFDYTPAPAAYDTERGFKHPGCLHTQADFDRIKQQLASGNEKVTAAYGVLRNAAYAQPTVGTSPVETIVRGGTGENYMNAARGAAAAYQNALRWKIEDNRQCAAAAVRILMAWANTTKNIGGDSNYALAAGLYGYQFANAAELVRDFDGWSPAQFTRFKQWMLSVWYPAAIDFLRRRNGTWENAGKWWQAPGHYWSNWGLCNTLCVMSIGVLCDDVFIYNQGLSYFKYDQVGTFTDPRTGTPILNDGLTEYLGNLVVTTTPSALETGAYGQLGQMQESGRDGGHAAMAAGLAIDVAHLGFNQGDDLFSYMNHRLAAGIEYLAAQTQSVPDLPWTDYKYGSSGYYYTDSRSWLMTEPALGAQIRPYWGTVIGIYEGVKGVKMPYSEQAYQQMGIDGGGIGATSGGYDHLGYSVLMNTYDGLAPQEKVPTELSGAIEYDGQQIPHNELGGLKNTYQTDNQTGLPKGKSATLMPQLPAGEDDTGLWSWNTGETTRNITVSTDRSSVYRVTYTNASGIASEQVFTLAVDGDCEPATAAQCTINYQGTSLPTDSITVFYGETVSLNYANRGGYGTYLWDNGTTGATLNTQPITRPRTYTVAFTNQGGARTLHTFKVNVKYMRVEMSVNDSLMTDTTTAIVKQGDNVVIGPYVPSALAGCRYQWSNGVNTRTITFDSIQQSGDFMLDYTINGQQGTLNYQLLVHDSLPSTIVPGNYLIKNTLTGAYMRCNGKVKKVTFTSGDEAAPDSSIVWTISPADDDGLYFIQSRADSLNLTGGFMTRLGGTRAPFRFEQALGTNLYAIRYQTSWYGMAHEDSTVYINPALEAFPFVLIPVADDPTGVAVPRHEDQAKTTYFTLGGIPLARPERGILIRKTVTKDGEVEIKKVKIE